MDVTMIGLQNAGKTSLLRVLAVSERNMRKALHHVVNETAVLTFGIPYHQGGEFAIE